MKTDSIYKRLAQAMVNREAQQARGIVSEIRGEKITIRTFLDLMKWQTAIEDENSKYTFVFDLEPNLKTIFENAEREKNQVVASHD